VKSLSPNKTDILSYIIEVRWKLII
jgi:hypothetical protein